MTNTNRTYGTFSYWSDSKCEWVTFDTWMDKRGFIEGETPREDYGDHKWVHKKEEKEEKKQLCCVSSNKYSSDIVKCLEVSIEELSKYVSRKYAQKIIDLHSKGKLYGLYFTPSGKLRDKSSLYK